MGFAYLEDILEEKLKIKPLTKSQIIISLDRLTRFKFTEEKYLRVFKDIITSNLIYPKYKKNELTLMDFGTLTKLAEDIFDFSLKSLGIPLSGDFSINKRLLEYEKSIFVVDNNAQKLLNNKIDYKAAVALLNCEDLTSLPLNLKWLKSLAEDDNKIETRKNLGLKFPLEKIVIVEGITEEILLPKFAKICGYDFDKNGIHLIAAGGKKQVVRIFYQFADSLKLPMFVLLDNDAKENFNEIRPKLRKNDKVHILKSGEFEDTLPLPLIKRTLNNHLKNHSPIALDDLRKDCPMTQILGNIFKERKMEFKKAEFAAFIFEDIVGLKDISDEIKTVISELEK